MEQLPSLALIGLIALATVQTVVTGFCFAYYVWKNLSLVSGVPAEFARRRMDLEERRLVLEEEAARHMSKMREFSAERSMQLEQRAEQSRQRIDSLRTPGLGLGVANVER